MTQLLIAINLLVTLMLPLQVFAGGPLDTVQGHVNQVLDVLRDPNLKAESAKETKERKIESIADALFDYAALSRFTLGRNWKKLNSDQRTEFVQLFRQILQKTYMDTILSYSDEKVVFDREVMLSEDKAEVQSKIITSSKEIPIFYRAYLKSGQWKVYDIIVEGVSLVKNYRTQFNEILAKQSPDELLKIMRQKVGKA